MSLEQFNLHQADTKSRVDSLVKAIFVLSGGALTISIGLFTDTSKIKLTESLKDTLQISWSALFTAIISLVLVQFIMIARDYSFGELWRKNMNGANNDVSGQPGIADKLLWAFGVLGLIGFLAGMLSLAYVSIMVINVT